MSPAGPEDLGKACVIQGRIAALRRCDVISRFLVGETLNQCWCAEHYRGEEKVSDHSMTEERDADTVAGQKPGGSLGIHIPRGPNGKVADQEEGNRSSQGARHEANSSSVRERRAEPEHRGIPRPGHEGIPREWVTIDQGGQQYV